MQELVIYNKGDDTVDREEFDRAKVLLSVIESNEKGLEDIKQLKECNEIMLLPTNGKAYEVFKKAKEKERVYYDTSKGEIPARFYSGESKNIILNALIKEYEERLDKLNKEFEAL